MGQTISSAKDEVNKIAEAERDKATQNLDLLQAMVKNQLDKYELELDNLFLNQAATMKTQVPGIRALRKERGTLVKTSTNPSVTVDSAIDSFFDIGKNKPAANETEGTKSEVGKDDHSMRDGFKALVKATLNVFLGNHEAGQRDESKYFVYVQHRVVVRLDVKLWAWHFAGEGLSSTYQSCMGYVICLSVVDPSYLHTVEFVYLISEYTDDNDEKTRQYIMDMASLYDQARKLKMNATDRIPRKRVDEGRTGSVVTLG